jgi:hypothetical protein
MAGTDFCQPVADLSPWKGAISSLPIYTQELLMRRTDLQRLAHEAGLDFFSGLSQPGVHFPQSEQPSAASLYGDFGEGFSPHWENAWIDLGGEG